MMLLKSWRKIVFVAPILLLFSCGYHLRGAIDLPPQMRKVYLAGASESLSDQFTTTLKMASGKMVNSAGQAGVVVQISNERMARRVVTLSNTGKANQFELDYSLNFQLLDGKGKALTKPEELDINRDYYNNQLAIMAKTTEEGVLRTELYQQAVRTIIDRAQFYFAPPK